MTNELDEYLVNKYPKIFADRYKDMKETAMCWGFEHDDGWFWLLDQLCSSIQSYIDTNNKYQSLDKQIPQVVATQVKEKFGYLNFYFNGGDKYIDGMVSLAESMSQNICERCGTIENVGRTKGPWIFTICKNCYDKDERLVNGNFIWNPNKNYQKI
jgi:hypothetical protein